VAQLAIHGETLRNALSEPNLTESKLHEIANNVIEFTKDFPGWGPVTEPFYPASKAFLNTYVRQFLPAKLKATQQCYAVHPGWVKTDMGGEDAPLALEEGADSIVYLTGLPFVVNPELNAKFIAERKVMEF